MKKLIPASADRLLRAIISTPLMHRLHHSVLRNEHGSNYGSMFSFWGRLFGSFRLKDEIRNMKIGLGNDMSTEQQRTGAFLLRPFHS